MFKPRFQKDKVPMPRKKGALVFGAVLGVVVVGADGATKSDNPLDQGDPDTFTIEAPAITSTATSSVLIGQNMVTGEVYEIPRPEPGNRVHFILTDVSSGSRFRST